MHSVHNNYLQMTQPNNSDTRDRILLNISPVVILLSVGTVDPKALESEILKSEILDEGILDPVISGIITFNSGICC